ncbi:MAG TPA: CDP-alcohol phosphatidyltransferase family protein [Terrimicrobiaceae bacterium]
MKQPNAARRPIKARESAWAERIADWLARAGVRPNIISVASAVFAAGAGLCLAFTDRWPESLRPWLFLAAAGLIQLRLLCNLFDGMVALEGGYKTKSGEIFNELPDRFADIFIFVGAGYAATDVEWSAMAGWLCAVLALLTAYVRALGGSAGASQQFCGPMAKQHRMAIMTLACCASAVLGWYDRSWAVIAVALILVAAGSLITTVRRAVRIVRELEGK